MSYLRDKLPELSPPVVERVFTPDLKGLCDWLETMPPEQRYNWSSCGDCVFAQFLKAIGSKDFREVITAHIGVVGGTGFEDKCRRYESVAWVEPWTFGAALLRAQALTEAK